MKKKGIVSFDLDMTLLDHQSLQIPPSALKALELLRENYYIVLATGRDMDAYYSRQYLDWVKPDGVIHLNGTKISVGDQVLHRHQMDSALLEQLLLFARQEGFCLGATVGDADYYVHPEVLEFLETALWGECGRQFQDPMKLLDIGVQTLAFFQMPDSEYDGIAAVEAAFPQLRLLPFAGKSGADVVEWSSSKAKGLERLCRHFDVKMENCYAFGDSMNDWEIIKAAGCGVAMGNAVEELKAVADYVTDPIDQNGIWNACRHLGLI